MKNDIARQHGIPKWLRQYAKRYGVSVEGIVQTHKKNPGPMLDHWRDRCGLVRPYGVEDWK